MKLSTRSPKSALVLLLPVALAGCTHMINAPKTAYTGYAPQEKIPLKVGLVLTDELRSAKWERNSMGDKFITPIGTNLCLNAETLAQQLFAGVTTGTKAAQLKAAGVDALLTPKLAFISRTFGATAFGKSMMSIKLEWNLTDLRGNVVWDDTITGQAQGGTGNMFTFSHNAQKLVQTAIEDLFKNSYEAMSSAEAIRQFARKKGSISRSATAPLRALAVQQTKLALALPRPMPRRSE